MCQGFPDCQRFQGISDRNQLRPYTPRAEPSKMALSTSRSGDSIDGSCRCKVMSPGKRISSHRTMSATMGATVAYVMHCASVVSWARPTSRKAWAAFKASVLIVAVSAARCLLLRPPLSAVAEGAFGCSISSIASSFSLSLALSVCLSLSLSLSLSRISSSVFFHIPEGQLSPSFFLLGFGVVGRPFMEWSPLWGFPRNAQTTGQALSF